MLNYLYILSLLCLVRVNLSQHLYCNRSNGETGVCRVPSECVGVSLGEIENNSCDLGDDIIGACCVDFTFNNIKNIKDGEKENIELPDITVIDVQNFFRFASHTEVKDYKYDVETEKRIKVDSSEPSAIHHKFNAASDLAKRIDKNAAYFLDITQHFQAGKNLTSKEAGIGLRSDFNFRTNHKLEKMCPWTPTPICNEQNKYRSFDGTCNNLKKPNYGRSTTPFQRIMLPQYGENTINLPRTKTGHFYLPTARDISNRLAKGANSVDRENTILLMQMGQFIDHDLTHTPAADTKCCDDEQKENPNCFPIQIKENDPFWKGSKTCMEFSRSLSSPSLDCELGHREQLNQITHWMDGSNIYGSTLEEANELRSHVGGKLKISQQGDSSHGYLPSCQGKQAGQVHGCDLCKDNNNEGEKKDRCFFAGDLRVNEQLNLIVMHTIFMREHNRLAEALEKINPCWKDERIFEESRRIVVAEYQHIVYKEWLPIILGNSYMRVYGMLSLNSEYSLDYADDFDPRISNEFATAAFRFGHSLIPNHFNIDKGNGRMAPNETMRLKEMFFKPEKLKATGMLESLMHGMMDQHGQAADSSFSDDLRNHLFESQKGAGGLDLVALNIQRGRDHGLPGYTKYRELCKIGKATQWSHLHSTIDPKDVLKLKQVYRSVEDIDLFVGAFLEKPHSDSIVGPVFKCIIGDQFLRLKKGDRFFYDLGNDANTRFTTEQLIQIRKTSLAKIVCDNTDDVTRVQPFIFKMQNNGANALTSCGNIPAMDLGAFQEICPRTSRQSLPVAPCVTEGGADIGAECVFPFRYKGVEHYGCTTVDDEETKPWCSTRTDKDGWHVANKGNWGHCPGHCSEV